MNDEELYEKVWKPLDTRLTTINERTKSHTLSIKQIERRLKELENKK